MKPINILPFLSLLLLLAPSSGNAAGSMLRVSCDGDDVGAEVLVNGEFRGECPIDLQVPKGALKLLVRKKVDGGRERVFEQDIRMGEGSVKKVEAHLGAAKLNADEEARQVENSRRLKTMPLDALQKEAASGNVDAMLMLAKKYFFGANVTPKSEELAGPLFLKAAEAGNVEAMYLLSVFFTSRKGVPDDYVQMRIWLVKAAEAGNVNAMLSLAKRYENGSGLPQSNDEALRWYRQAAEQGNTSAMITIGMLCYSGKGGVSQNDVEAVEWFRKAADAGDNVAMWRLGRFYAEGEGVTTSEEQAIYWWRKAAEGKQPNSDAVKELKKRGLR